MNMHRKPYLISITGFSGSGKTELARRLARMLGATLVELDWFLIERDKRPGDGFADKFALNEAEACVSRLLASHSVTLDAYNQASRKRDQRITLLPAPIVIIEGVLALTLNSVWDHPNSLKVWVEAEAKADWRQLHRAQTQGWLSGMTLEQQLEQIESKHLTEWPVIVRQRPLCDLELANAGVPISDELLDPVLERAERMRSNKRVGLQSV